MLKGILFILFLVFIGIVNASLSDCYSSCEEQYNLAIEQAQQKAAQGLYYENIETSNCPRITTSLYNGNEYSTCAVYVWKCDWNNAPETCKQGLQQCCFNEAKISAQRLLEQCKSKCQKQESEVCEPYCSDNLYNSQCAIINGECSCLRQEVCENGCSNYGCIEQGLCKNKECNNYCEGNTYYYNGSCNGEDGNCYYSYELCENGCDEQGLKCKIEQKPNIELLLSKKEVILNPRDNKVKITIALKDQNGEPIKGIKVYLRVEDPESTGLLGMWGAKSIIRYTNEQGIISGTLTLPTIDSIKSIYYDRFPYKLDIEAIAMKQGQWNIKTKDSLTIKNPMPIIKTVTLSPNPAKTYYTHNLKVEIEDPDSDQFTYLFRNYGGSWKENKEALVLTNRVYGFRSSSKNEIVQWQSPIRGLNKEEIIMAREMEGVGESLATNLALSSSKAGSEYLAKKYGEKTIGKIAKNFVPILNTGKTIYGIYGNIKNMAYDAKYIGESQSITEFMWRTVDFTLEGSKTTVGVITLFGKEVPVIGGFADLTQDFIDSLIGTMQAKVNDLAGKERIRNAETLEEDYAFSIVVKDQDGYKTEYYFPYKMEYLGFKD